MFRMFEEEDQSAYFLFLFVSAGRKKNVFAALCFKIYLFTFGNTSRCIFVLFLRSFVTVASHRWRTFKFVSGMNIWIACMKMNQTKDYVVILFWKSQNSWFCELVCPQGLRFYKKNKNNGWQTCSFLAIFLYMKFLTHLLVFAAAVQVASVQVLVFMGGGWKRLLSPLKKTRQENKMLCDTYTYMSIYKHIMLVKFAKFVEGEEVRHIHVYIYTL